MRKIEQIIREEMDRAGGQEIVHAGAPAGRAVGGVRPRSRRWPTCCCTSRTAASATFVLGPTHEEVVVDLFKQQVQSYRDMPVMLYQIQTKFRDEARPRGGLMRVREFTMKDAYSFDTDWDALDASYAARAASAYARIFERCGVPDDPGARRLGRHRRQGQRGVHLPDRGRRGQILLCPNCGYAANEEKADHKKKELPFEEPLPLEEVATPGQKTIDELVAFLGVPHYKTLKAVFYEARRRAGVRRDPRRPGGQRGEAAQRAQGAGPGAARRRRRPQARPRRRVGLAGRPERHHGRRRRLCARTRTTSSPAPTSPTCTCATSTTAATGPRTIVTDIALARAGSACPRCGTPLETRRGMEMGHVFKLGTVYTERLRCDVRR